LHVKKKSKMCICSTRLHYLSPTIHLLPSPWWPEASMAALHCLIYPIHCYHPHSVTVDCWAKMYHYLQWLTSIEAFCWALLYKYPFHCIIQWTFCVELTFVSTSKYIQVFFQIMWCRQTAHKRQWRSSQLYLVCINNLSIHD